MDIEKILDQAPENTTKELVAELLTKHDGNIVDVLSSLWELDNHCTSNERNVSNERNEHRDKWNNIRDICHSYEEAMHQKMI